MTKKDDNIALEGKGRLKKMLGLMKLLIEIAPDKKVLAFIMIVGYFGGGYVLSEAKGMHLVAMAAVDKQEESRSDDRKEIERMATAQSNMATSNAVIAEALKGISSHMKEIKDSVKKTDDRLWRLNDAVKSLKGEIK